MNRFEGCGCLALFLLLVLCLLGSDDNITLWAFIALLSILVLVVIFVPFFKNDDQNTTDHNTKTDSTNHYGSSSYDGGPYVSSHSSYTSSPNTYVNTSSNTPSTYLDEDGFEYSANSQTGTSYDVFDSQDDYPQNLKETLLVADEILQYSQRLEKDPAFLSELSKHNIEFNDENGNPLLGHGADVRRLFFIDIAHCYSEMNQQINLNDIDGMGVLYLLTALHDPGTNYNHSKEHMSLIREYTADTFTRYVKAIAAAPVFREDDEADSMVALLLLQYDHEQFCQYLTLLYRFCTLIAKGDGSISLKEHTFLNHIIQLRDNTPHTNGNMTATETISHHGGLAELDSLIGLESVKREVHTMSNFIKIQLSRQKQGLKTTPISYHCVFTGNPGTGKTTVARIIAGIYAELGVLEKGHLIETDRSGLVAEYEGQTAVKTNKVIDRALGGVLFIDEAYSLVSGDQTDFGKEAVSTLLKRMEDERDRLIVILAGYGEEMKLFIDSNPGLQSRFNRYIHFPDYTAEELYQIFLSLVKKYDYDLTSEASRTIRNHLSSLVEHKEKNFGNGRTVRNLFEKVLERQANRLATINHPTLAQLKEIIVDDCVNV